MIASNHLHILHQFFRRYIDFSSFELLATLPLAHAWWYYEEVSDLTA